LACSTTSEIFKTNSWDKPRLWRSIISDKTKETLLFTKQIKRINVDNYMTFNMFNNKYSLYSLLDKPYTSV